MSRVYSFTVDDDQVPEMEAWAKEKGYRTVGAAARVSLCRQMAQYPRHDVKLRMVKEGHGDCPSDAQGGTPLASGED